MKLTNKKNLMAALSVFQITASTASASLQQVFVAENAQQKVICNVNGLDRKKAQDWPGMVMDKTYTRRDSNREILADIEANFAGGNYFDEYPHKLPDIFKAGACDTIEKK